MDWVNFDFQGENCCRLACHPIIHNTLWQNLGINFSWIAIKSKKKSYEINLPYSIMPSKCIPPPLWDTYYMYLPYSMECTKSSTSGGNWRLWSVYTCRTHCQYQFGMVQGATQRGDFPPLLTTLPSPNKNPLDWNISRR